MPLGSAIYFPVEGSDLGIWAATQPWQRQQICTIKLPWPKRLWKRSSMTRWNAAMELLFVNSFWDWLDWLTRNAYGSNTLNFTSNSSQMDIHSSSCPPNMEKKMGFDPPAYPSSWLRFLQYIMHSFWPIPCLPVAKQFHIHILTHHYIPYKPTTTPSRLIHVWSNLKPGGNTSSMSRN